MWCLLMMNSYMLLQIACFCKWFYTLWTIKVSSLLQILISFFKLLACAYDFVHKNNWRVSLHCEFLHALNHLLVNMFLYTTNNYMVPSCIFKWFACPNVLVTANNCSVSLQCEFSHDSSNGVLAQTFGYTPNNCRVSLQCELLCICFFKWKQL